MGAHFKLFFVEWNICVKAEQSFSSERVRGFNSTDIQSCVLEQDGESIAASDVRPVSLNVL